MISASKPNASIPFLQGVPNSMVSREWYLFLSAVQAIITSPASGPTTTIDALSILESFDAASPAQVAQIQIAIADLQSAIASQVEFNPAPLYAAIADIQRTLAMQTEFQPGALIQRLNDLDVMGAFK